MREVSRSAARRALAAVCAGGLVIAACAQQEGLEYDSPPTKSEYRNAPTVKEGTIFGPTGLNILGGETPSDPSAPIPVNSYLWRATLDTLSFMPLASADPFGGVIITDWFTPPESANERFKMTVYILSRQLRSDGLRVAVFRQQRDGSGIWVDSAVTPGTAGEVENAILTRARELRVARAGP